MSNMEPVPDADDLDAVDAEDEVRERLDEEADESS